MIFKIVKTLLILSLLILSTHTVKAQILESMFDGNNISITPSYTGACDTDPNGCSAAYSMSHALVGSYIGPLWQAVRRDNGATLDITQNLSHAANLSGAGGIGIWAFCSGTDCAVAKIYNQTSLGHALDISYPTSYMPSGQYGSNRLHYDCTPAKGTCAPLWLIDNTGMPMVAGAYPGGLESNPGPQFFAPVNGLPIGNTDRAVMTVGRFELSTNCCAAFGMMEPGVNFDVSGTMFALMQTGFYCTGGNSAYWGVFGDLESGGFGNCTTTSAGGRYVMEGRYNSNSMTISSFLNGEMVSAGLPSEEPGPNNVIRMFLAGDRSAVPAYIYDGMIFADSLDHTPAYNNLAAWYAAQTPFATPGPLDLDYQLSTTGNPPPLPVVGNSAGGYALRLLRASYTGYLADLEDSTSTIRSFAAVGADLDPAASTFCGAHPPCTVSKLYYQGTWNQGGVVANAHDAALDLTAPSSITQQPSVTFNNLNGHPTMHFSGAQLLCSATWTGVWASPYTTWAVMRRTGNFTTLGEGYSTKSFGGYVGLNSTANTAVGVPGFGSVTANALDNSWHDLILDTPVNGAGNFYIDHASPTTGGSSGGSVLNGHACIGGDSTNGDYLVGDIAEAGAISRLTGKGLTTSHQPQILSNDENYWGTMPNPVGSNVATSISIPTNTYNATSNNANAVIAPITVNTSNTGGAPSAFTGTISLSGTNASSFALSSTTLPATLKVGSVSLSPGTYSINIVAGSITQPETITIGVPSVINVSLAAPRVVTSVNNAGTFVGNIGVATNPDSTYTGTVTLGGAAASNFTISGNGLYIGASNLLAGKYPITFSAGGFTSPVFTVIIVCPSDSIFITNQSGSSISNYPFQFGRPFKDGDFVAGQMPQVLVNGIAQPTQVDIKNKYPDGSIEFAVLAVIIPGPIPNNGTATLSFQSVSNVSNTPLTQAQMLSGTYNFEGTMSLPGPAQIVGINNNSNFSTIHAISNGGFNITVNGVLETITGLNFTGISNANGIGQVIQERMTALGYTTTRVYSMNDNGTSAERTVIETQGLGVGNSLTYASAPGSGTDVSALLGWTSGTKYQATLTAVTPTVSARNMLNNGSYTLWTGGSTPYPSLSTSGTPIAQTIQLADDTTTASYDIGWGDGHTPFRPRYFATFWPSTEQVYLRFVGENSETTQAEDSKYALTLTAGTTPVTIYQKDFSNTGGNPVGLAITGYTAGSTLGAGSTGSLTLTGTPSSSIVAGVSYSLYDQNTGIFLTDVNGVSSTSVTITNNCCGVTTGDVLLFVQGGVNINYWGTVWSRETWLNGTPPLQINIDNNLAYIESTRYVQNFSTNAVITAADITNYYAVWHTNVNHDLCDFIENSGGLQAGNMEATGAHDNLGPMNSWDAVWLYTGDWHLRQISYEQADIAGCWPGAIRETDPTKRMLTTDPVVNPASGLGLNVSVTDRKTSTSQNWFTGGTTGSNVVVTGIVDHSVPLWQEAHLSKAYNPGYIMTGDPWFLSQIAAWAGNEVSWTGGGARGPTGAEGGIRDETRGEGWGLNSRSEAAFLMPDNTSQRQYFIEQTNSAIAFQEGALLINDPNFDTTAEWIYGKSAGNNNTISSCGINGSGSYYTAGHVLPGALGQFEAECFNTDGAPDDYASFPPSWSAGETWEMWYLQEVLGRVTEMGFASKPEQLFSGQYVTGLTNSSDPYIIGSYSTGAERLGEGFSGYMTSSPAQLHITSVSFGPHGVLACAPLTSAQQTMSNWTAITAGHFGISLDGAPSVDIGPLNFSTQTNLTGVASVIQSALTTAGINATVRWEEISSTGVNSPSFIFSSNNFGAGTGIGYLTPGSSNDISTQLQGTSATFAWVIPYPSFIGDLITGGSGTGFNPSSACTQVTKSGCNVAYPTHITGLVSGTDGGIGVYSVDNGQNIYSSGTPGLFAGSHYYQTFPEIVSSKYPSYINGTGPYNINNAQGLGPQGYGEFGYFNIYLAPNGDRSALTVSDIAMLVDQSASYAQGGTAAQAWAWTSANIAKGIPDWHSVTPKWYIVPRTDTNVLPAFPLTQP